MSGAATWQSEACSSARILLEVRDGGGEAGNRALMRRLAQPLGGAQRCPGLAFQASQLLIPCGQDVLQGGGRAGRFTVIHAGSMEGGNGRAKGVIAGCIVAGMPAVVDYPSARE